MSQIPEDRTDATCRRPLSKKAATEMITRFAEAVRADERNSDRPRDRSYKVYREYREARSELACWLHRLLDELSAGRGEKEVLEDKLHHTERRLAEANALLETVCEYVDSHDLAKLGQSRVQALIDDHKVKSRFIMQAMLEKKI